MNEQYKSKSDDPPLLYDLIMSGEKVREAGGPWLDSEDKHDRLLSAPEPPPLQSLWAREERHELSSAQPPTARDTATSPDADTERARASTPVAAPTTIDEVPAELRAEIERQACRTLAHHFRGEIRDRLDEAMKQAEEPIRKTIEDVLVNAVANTRKNQ